MAIVGVVCVVAFFAGATWFAFSGWSQYQHLTETPDTPIVLHRIEIGILKVAGPAALLAAWELVAALFALGGIVSAWEAYKLFAGRSTEPVSEGKEPASATVVVSVAAVATLLVVGVIFHIIGTFAH